LPPIPVLKATVSAKANCGLWQLAQLMVASLDNNFSENNFLPRLALVFISAFLSLKELLTINKLVIIIKIEQTDFFIPANLI
jgi:hypothetical protein